MTRRERVIPTVECPDACAGYTFGCPVGTWTARIDYRVWGNGKNLRLYVTDTSNGAQWWLSVFHLDGYRPPKGGPNFADDVATGDVLELTTSHTKGGNPHLSGARLIAVSEA